jgi:arylsulfate sulfotransferase
MKYATLSRRARAAIVVILLLPLLVPVLIVFPVTGDRMAIELSDEQPLGGELQVRTVRPVAVGITVRGLDGEDLVFESQEFRRVQTVPVLGLYPDHHNVISVTLTFRNGVRRVRELGVKTEPLPPDFPEPVVTTPFPDLVEPGVTFLNMGRYDDEQEYRSLPAAIDRFGRVRWFLPEGTRHVLRRLEDGSLMIQRHETLMTIDMLGRPDGREWTAPEGIHHDAIELPDGNFLALSAAPGSYDDGVVKIDRRTGETVQSWDFRQLLDPERPRQPINLADEDWLHLNGVAWDDRDGAFIVSGRDQSALVKVDRAAGVVRWILGAHDHWDEPFRSLLLEPAGRPFEWSWGQHAPEVWTGTDAAGAVKGRPPGPLRLLVYDNGNHRSYGNPLPPAENYSRAVEYEIDEAAGTVRQVWQYGRERGSELFTPFIGDADYLSNGDRLITFGGISRDRQGRAIPLFDLEAMEVRDMKISARIVEVTGESPGRVVQELVLEDTDSTSWRGYRVYRSERMSLYPTDPE